MWQRCYQSTVVNCGRGQWLPGPPSGAIFSANPGWFSACQSLWYTFSILVVGYFVIRDGVKSNPLQCLDILLRNISDNLNFNGKKTLRQSLCDTRWLPRVDCSKCSPLRPWVRDCCLRQVPRKWWHWLRITILENSLTIAGCRMGTYNKDYVYQKHIVLFRAGFQTNFCEGTTGSSIVLNLLYASSYRITKLLVKQPSGSDSFFKQEWKKT